MQTKLVRVYGMFGLAFDYHYWHLLGFVEGKEVVCEYFFWDGHESFLMAAFGEIVAGFDAFDSAFGEIVAGFDAFDFGVAGWLYSVYVDCLGY